MDILTPLYKYVKKMIEEIHGLIFEEKRYFGWENIIHPDAEILDKILRSTGLDTLVLKYLSIILHLSAHKLHFSPPLTKSPTTGYTAKYSCIGGDFSFDASQQWNIMQKEHSFNFLHFCILSTSVYSFFTTYT